jgi:carbonic anhydrase
MVIQVSVVSVVNLAAKAHQGFKAHRVHKENQGQLGLLAVFTTRMNQELRNNVVGFRVALQCKITNNDI